MATEDTAHDVPDPEKPASKPGKPAAEPQKHQHSDHLLRACDALGISRERAELLDKAALREEIQDAQLAYSVTQARVEPVAREQPKPPEPEPDEEFVIPPELEAELNDAPGGKATIKLLKTVGKKALKADKLEKQIQQVRQQSSSQSVEAQVNAVLATIPTPGKVGRNTRDRAIYNELACLEKEGRLRGLNLEQCVRLAHESVYGTAGTQQSVGGGNGIPAPTTSAKPTNRLGNDKGKSRREQLIEAYTDALADAKDQEALNGEFIP
jgi:hypothetical protein